MAQIATAERCKGCATLLTFAGEFQDRILSVQCFICTARARAKDPKANEVVRQVVNPVYIARAAAEAIESPVCPCCLGETAAFQRRVKEPV